MALLTSCQNTFQNVTAYEEAVDDVEALKVQVRECYTEITKTSEQISSTARETYVTKSDLETFQQDFQTSITETATEIRMDFSERADTISNQVATNQTLLEEGEVPQYYVEGSHEAIIDPVLFDQAQKEMERRRRLGNAYSGKSVFSSRLICGDCGHFLGSKVWHSTSKYRKTIWQCNYKFKGEHKCLCTMTGLIM